MINSDKLKAVLNVYKKDFISKQWNNEKYKWEAVKHFQEHWDINATDFLNMFMKATDKTGNLLASMNNFPRGMIKAFAEANAEAVRAMFINLFDESKNFVERIEKFQSDSEWLRIKHGSDIWKQSYQNPNSISTYLWLRYPDKYYIYKYSEFRAVAKELDSDFIPKKGASSVNLSGFFNLYNEICEQISLDEELVKLLQSVITDSCYPDKKLKTLSIDVGFYISRYYLKKPVADTSEWFPANYNPNITTEEWLSLLTNENVFTKSSLEIMKRMKDYGGMATCTQLSIKYGETKNFYNVGSSSLAKRVAETTGCPVFTTDNESTKWWPILYVGKNADKDTDGGYIWRLRDELSNALEQFDLSQVSLNASPTDSTEVHGYWWLNANPKIWSFFDLGIGESQSYTLLNENGNKRKVYQNFLDAKEGDLVIGYESKPVKQVVAIAKVSKENDGERLYFEKIEGLANPIDYSKLKDCHELKNMEYFINPQGSLFKLTKVEYEFIMDIVREENPVVIKEPAGSYLKDDFTKDDFLKDVYMTDERFDTLVSLLKHKQNLILQGPPGVGKTYAAKRLAYAILKEKDDSCIEFIQFHQNYSYEDFIMGYKPQGTEFELQYGIFYRFCQKASNSKDPNKPYFFIIDEINRGNMSKIFGELLMLIEKDYRGTKVTLAYNKLPFTVPKNLFIIGMMNTADRSLAMIDYALRRRFSFFEMEPGFSSDGFKAYHAGFDNDTFNTLIERIKELNKEIAADSSLGKGFCIGHSYFCGQKECTDEWMIEVVEYELLPMLSEYWFDEPTKLKRWENILRGVFND